MDNNKKQKIYIIAAVIVALLIAIITGMICYKIDISHKVENEPEIVTIPRADNNDIKKAIPSASKSEVKDIQHRIERVTETTVPKYEFYTVNTEKADSIVKAYAKEDKADKVIKTTDEVKANGSDNKIIENKYYAINMNRKHDIKAGGAYVNDTGYVTLSYRNRQIEYTGFYNPAVKSGGAGISYVIAKW